MEINQLLKMKSGVIFDVSAMKHDHNSQAKFHRYSLGLENFMKHSNVDFAFLKITKETNNCFLCRSMEITADSLFNIYMKIFNKTKIKLLIAFGHFKELIARSHDFQVNFSLIITDDDISQEDYIDLPQNIRVLPSRILYHLYDQNWWKVTPIEMIPSNLRERKILHDKSENELSLMAQKALSLHSNDDWDHCAHLLNRSLILCPDHVYTRLILAGIYITDLKNEKISSNEESIFANNIVDILLEVQNIIKTNEPKKKQNRKDYAELIAKMQLLIIQVIPLLTSEAISRLQHSFPDMMKLF